MIAVSIPWGEVWDKSKCNNAVGEEKDIYLTTKVDEYEGKGNSPFGVVDMVGNVQEWCLPFNKNSNIRISRGGSFCEMDASKFRCDYRDVDYTDARYYDIGFRVVRSYLK